MQDSIKINTSSNFAYFITSNADNLDCFMILYFKISLLKYNFDFLTNNLYNKFMLYYSIKY